MLNFYSEYPFVRVSSYVDFKPPYNRWYPATTAYSLGGEIRSFENQDKDTHVWVAEVRNDNEIWLYREDLGSASATLEYTHTDEIKQLDLALDQLNNPEFCFVGANADSFIYWYNLREWELYKIPYKYPRMALSHHKVAQAPISDVHVFASEGGNLYVANQRESFKRWKKIFEGEKKVLAWRAGVTKRGTFGILFR